MRVTRTKASGFSTGSGFKMMALYKAKPAEFAPMPSARVIIRTVVETGFLFSFRAAYCRSRKKSYIVPDSNSLAWIAGQAKQENAIGALVLVDRVNNPSPP